MDSQITRQSDRDYDKHIPSVGFPSVTEGEGDHHQEKKSVLNKVKAKAKKIKDTLKPHGHDNGHDNDYDDNQNDHSHEEEEYDDVGDEIVEDPARHGPAPMAAEGRYDSKNTDPPARPLLQMQDDNLGKSGGNAGRSTAVEIAEHVPENRDLPLSSSTGIFVHGSGKRMGDSGEPKINVGTPTALEEDPHAPKEKSEPSNYQTKVTDPTGTAGEEAAITPILRSFKKMNVYDDEPESKTKSPEAPLYYTGDQIPPQTTINRDVPAGSILNSFDGDKPQDIPRDTTVTKQASSNQSGYTEKISYVTSAIADKAITAKNVVASKLGYGGNEDHSEATSRSIDRTQGGEQIGKSGSTGQNVVGTVTEKLTPVYEKVSSVGSSVVSKVRGTGLEQERGDEGKEKGGSVKEYFAEKLRPSEEDKALSDVISDALHKGKSETEGKPAVGKVMESEEVRKRLGSDEDCNREMTETESRVAANVSPTGKTMVESVKGAVSSWFSTGGDQKEPSVPSSPGTAHAGEDRLPSSTGEAAAAYHGQDGVGKGRDFKN